jgi:hypothetical protein
MNTSGTPSFLGGAAEEANDHIKTVKSLLWWVAIPLLFLLVMRRGGGCRMMGMGRPDSVFLCAATCLEAFDKDPSALRIKDTRAKDPTLTGTLAVAEALRRIPQALRWRAWSARARAGSARFPAFLAVVHTLRDAHSRNERLDGAMSFSSVSVVGNAPRPRRTNVWPTSTRIDP